MSHNLTTSLKHPHSHYHLTTKQTQNGNLSSHPEAGGHRSPDRRLRAIQRGRRQATRCQARLLHHRCLQALDAFKERTFGKKKEGEQENGDEAEGDGEVKTPPPKAKGGKKGSASGGSGKKRGRENGEIEGEATPSKKAATKKAPRGKKGGQAVKAEENGESEQVGNGEEEGDGFVENDERLEDGLQQEFYENAEEQVEN